jgi:hypothetical protein
MSTYNRDFPGLILAICGKFVSIKGLRQCHRTDCKTVYPGSIPGVASKPSRFKSLASALAREILIRCGRAAVLQELQILTHEAAFKAGAALL